MGLRWTAAVNLTACATVVLAGGSAADLLGRQAGPPYELAFATTRGPQGLYVTAADSTAPRLVHAERGAMLDRGSWSPDGRVIAHFGMPDDDAAVYERYQLPLHFALHVVSPDGTGHARLVDFPVEPFLAWSPDSTRLAVSSGYEDPRLSDPATARRIASNLQAYSAALYVVDIRTRAVTRVSSLPHSRSASWAPDNRRIAFSATSTEGGSNVDIHVVEAAGGTPRRVATATTPTVQPAWSPNGRQVAFVTTPGLGGASGGGVSIVDADGGRPRLVWAGVAQSVSWSPDAQRLLVRGPNVIVELASGRTYTLEGPMMDPTFTPDGRCVIFRAPQAGGFVVAVVDIDGGNRRTFAAHPDVPGFFAVSPRLRTN